LVEGLATTPVGSDVGDASRHALYVAHVSAAVQGHRGRREAGAGWEATSPDRPLELAYGAERGPALSAPAVMPGFRVLVQVLFVSASPAAVNRLSQPGS
jgi:hypothetical protein